MTVNKGYCGEKGTITTNSQISILWSKRKIWKDKMKRRTYSQITTALKMMTVLITTMRVLKRIQTTTRTNHMNEIT